MVDYLNYYAPVLNRAVEICNQLMAFFKSEQVEKTDRFAKAAAETKSTRDGILERLQEPKYLAPKLFHSSDITGFMAFYDNHATNDYGVSLSVEKLSTRNQLLAAWITDVVEPLARLMNQLKEKVS